MADTPVFGIDLGTTYSCIAYIEFDRPTVIPNAAGAYTTPSVVRFEGQERIVGLEAKQGGLIFPDETVNMVKRHIGKKTFFFFYDGKQITAEEVSSYIVKKLVKDASEYTGVEITDIVITCPAYFGIPERESTKLAGELCGLNVRAIINEPTAAAISYGLLEKDDQIVLVYDLGGGTFDVTLVRIADGGSTILATGGEDQLGGHDWDTAIVNYFVYQWQEETGSTNDPNETIETIQDFYIKAEEAKQRLTTLEKTQVMLAHDGQLARVTLTREKFDELTEGLLQRTIDLTHDVINDAIVGERISGISDIKQILLVGGSSRMPQVMQILDSTFPDIEKNLHKPDEAVALGAAIYGQKLQIGQKVLDQIDVQERQQIAEQMGKSVDEVTIDDIPKDKREDAEQNIANEMGLALGYVKDVVGKTIVNVTSRSFGLIAVDPATGKDVIRNLIRKNDPLPNTVSETFGTLEDNQQQADIYIVENFDSHQRVDDFHIEGVTEGSSGVSVRQLGMAVMKLQPNTPKGSHISVSFTLNEQGLLSMKALNVTSGEEVESEIQTEDSISEADIDDLKSNISGLSVL